MLEATDTYPSGKSVTQNTFFLTLRKLSSRKPASVLYQHQPLMELIKLICWKSDCSWNMCSCIYIRAAFVTNNFNLDFITFWFIKQYYNLWTVKFKPRVYLPLSLLQRVILGTLPLRISHFERYLLFIFLFA